MRSHPDPHSPLTAWPPAGGDPERFAGIRRDYTPADVASASPARSASATRWPRWAPTGCGTC